MKKIIITILILFYNITVFTGGNDIILPKPDKKIGMDLLQAIETRSASRSFSSKKVSLKKLSTILYAGYGIVKKQRGKTTLGYDAVSGATSRSRYTVPFGWESSYLNIYLLLKSGSYQYIPGEHKLKLITNKNLLGSINVASSNPFGAIIIAVDYNRMPGAGKSEMTKTVAYMSVGSVSQNIYIAASAYKIRTLSQIEMNKHLIINKLNLRKKVEPITVLSFGY